MNAVPVPFIMTKDGKFFFMFQHSEAIEFKFTELIDVQMGWFYFNITYLQSVKKPLYNLEHEKTAIKYAFLPSISCSNNKCFTAVSND